MYSAEKNTPVIVFTYNRPEHTVKTINALSDNYGANETEVFIYSDGWKNNKDEEKVREVRKYLHTLDKFKKVHIIERAINMGLADNIIDGVSSVINTYGKVIVIEDDIITSRWFLQYMNDALTKYENEKKVMAISGYLPPIRTDGLPQSFFTEIFECAGGWGTWSRCWNEFERNPDKLISNTSEEDIYRINISNTKDKWKQVILNERHIIKSWAIFFYALIIKNNGLVLNNSVNLSKNIGMDGTGENSGYQLSSDMRRLSEIRVNEFPDKIELNMLAMTHYVDYYRVEKAKYGSRIKRILYIVRNEGIKGIMKRARRKLQKLGR